MEKGHAPACLATVVRDVLKHTAEKPLDSCTVGAQMAVGRNGPDDVRTTGVPALRVGRLALRACLTLGES